MGIASNDYHDSRSHHKKHKGDENDHLRRIKTGLGAYDHASPAMRKRLSSITKSYKSRQDNYASNMMDVTKSHRSQLDAYPLYNPKYKNFLNEVDDSFQYCLKTMKEGFLEMGYNFDDLNNPNQK